MTELQGSMIVLHGPPKVGKTQFVDSMPGPVLFIATEHGHKFVKNKKSVKYFESGKAGWLKFRKMLDSGFITKNKRIKTVAVDTTTKLYERCSEWTCSENGWKHPSDGPHGKGWHAVRNEFGKQLERLAEQCFEIGATLVFVDHTTIDEVNAVVTTYHKMQCAMPTQPRAVVLPASDHIFFLGYEHFSDDVGVDSLDVAGHNRWLWVSGSETIEAGTRDPSITKQVIKNVPKDNPFEYVIRQLEE